MTWNGTDRKVTAFNLVRRAFEAKPKFASVKCEVPSAAPSKLGARSLIYLASGIETLQGFTNQEKDSAFRFSAIGFCRSNKDVEVEKIRFSGEMEETIMALQNTAEFIAKGMTMIDVVTIDRGPSALEVFGIQGPVIPPIGVVRLDVVVTFSYTAF